MTTIFMSSHQQAHTAAALARSAADAAEMRNALVAKRDWRAFGKKLLLEYRLVAMSILVVTGLVTFMLGNQSTFFYNLCISFFVGTIAFLIVHGTIFWLNFGDNKLSWWLIAGLAIAASLLALGLGLALGGSLLGISFDSLALSVRYNTNVYLIIMMIMVICTLALFWIKIRMEQLRAGIAQEKMRAEANARRSIQAQLQLLQAQIEPHMLFNTLANVQGLISFDPQRASHMLDQLIVYLRASLQSARAEKTTLAAEFELMQAYLDLMAVRMGPRLSYSLHLPPELARQTIAPMLLQPLVENAIKHGVEPKIEGGSITVSAQVLGKCLRICVTDTGMGLEAPAKHGTQIGLVNICERLSTLYGKEASFLLRPNQSQGAISTLILPLS